METVNPPTNRILIHVHLTPKEVQYIHQRTNLHTTTTKTLIFECPLVNFAEEACAVIMSDVFSPCHFLVNPAPFQRFCRHDVCVCVDGEECLCSALSAYAAACTAKGVLLNWRSPSLCGNSHTNYCLLMSVYLKMCAIKCTENSKNELNLFFHLKTKLKSTKVKMHLSWK